MASSSAMLFPPIIVEETFPFLHPKIDLHHLHDNLKLFTDNEVNAIQKWFNDNPSKDRYKMESCNGEHYSILRSHEITKPDHLYAIYYGVKKQKSIGEGAFGKVKLAQELRSGNWSALKVVKKNLNLSDDVTNEIIQHEEQGLMTHKMLNDFSQRQDKPHYLFVIDLLVGMSLDKLNDLLVTQLDKLRAAVSLCSDVAKLIDQNILHRDIKPGNYIYDRITGKGKLVDWQFYLPISNHTDNKLRGTNGFIAPENVIQVTKSTSSRIFTYNEKTEIYALGVTLIFLFNLAKINRFVHNGKAYPESVISIKDQGNHLDPSMNELINFLNLMIDKNPEDRPAINVVRQFFQERLTKIVERNSARKHIGILNIDEYINANIATKKSIIATLRNKDLAWFVDTQHRAKRDYLTLRRELEKNNILIGDKIFFETSNHPAALRVARQIPAYIKQQITSGKLYLDLEPKFYYSMLDNLDHEVCADLMSLGIFPLHISPIETSLNPERRMRV